MRRVRAGLVFFAVAPITAGLLAWAAWPRPTWTATLPGAAADRDVGFARRDTTDTFIPGDRWPTRDGSS